ncbi:MAG TPA: phospholipase D-like domain-containing protein, partial [Elusimicrobiota bacterium]|nr:phospholipase D-like domain-containing protein [Elusimicrobiota bacterium]
MRESTRFGALCAVLLAVSAAAFGEEVELGEAPSLDPYEISINPDENTAGTPVSVDVAEFGASTVTSVYFSPEDDCDNVIIGWLSQARRSIDAAVFLISHPGIADALAQAHLKGVKVRVIMDGEQADFKVASDEFLERAGVPLRRSFSKGSMHNKFAVIDGRTVLTGSYNWTVGGASVNDENLIVLHQAAAVFQRKFDQLWNT